ncbi:MAG: hypothetical protein GY725_13260 [bacterium]|nr:hypothetical protein [bacterium]
MKSPHANALLCWLALFCLAMFPGCASIPLDPVPSDGCADAPAPGGRYPDPEYCGQRHLVVGLFPTVGEHHLNDLSTKGMPLTPMRRAIDYTVFPVVISILNLTGFGLPSLYALIYEGFEEYHPSPGACSMSLLGFCKAQKSHPRPESNAQSTLPGENFTAGPQ